MSPRISSELNSNESIQLVEKYLKYSSSATFNHFVAKDKDNITNVSKYIHAQNAFNLMKYWVSTYNEAISYRDQQQNCNYYPRREHPPHSSQFSIPIPLWLKVMINSKTTQFLP